MNSPPRTITTVTCKYNLQKCRFIICNYLIILCKNNAVISYDILFAVMSFLFQFEIINKTIEISIAAS